MITEQESKRIALQEGIIALKNNLSVEALRKMKLKVKVHHERYAVDGRAENVLWPQCDLKSLARSQKGGRTTIYLNDSEDLINYMGFAHCNKIDPFNRKLGVRIALGRIIKFIEDDYNSKIPF